MDELCKLEVKYTQYIYIYLRLESRHFRCLVKVGKT